MKKGRISIIFLFFILFLFSNASSNDLTFELLTKKEKPIKPKKVIISGTPGSSTGRKCGNQVTLITVRTVPHKGLRYYTNKPIQLKVLAYYNQIKEVALAESDKEGHIKRVTAAYLTPNCNPELVPLKLPYTVELYQWVNGKLRPAPPDIWEASPGSIIIKKEGRYRVKVSLKGFKGIIKDPYRDPNPFRLAPVFGPLMNVYDKSKDRKGRILAEMVMLAPGSESPRQRNHLEINGKECKKSPRKCPCKKKYNFKSYAYYGTLDYEWETVGALKSKDKKPKSVKSVWELVDYITGDVISKKEKSKAFYLDPSSLGDGDYILYCYNPDAYYHRLGLQNYFGKRPAYTHIRIRNCGKGKKTHKQRISKEQQSLCQKLKKKLMNDSLKYQALKQQGKKVSPSDINPFLLGCGYGKVVNTDDILRTKKLHVDKLKGMQIVTEEREIKVVKKPGPKPADVPANKNCSCKELLKQIRHRRKQLSIPCTEPLSIMNKLVLAPIVYLRLVTQLVNEFNKGMTLVKNWCEPYYKLAKRYVAVAQKAKKANLIIPPEVWAKFKRRSSTGGPPVIGDGLPAQAFLWDKDKIKLSKELEKEQRDILDKWARKIREDRKNLEKYKKKLEQINKNIERLLSQIRELRFAHTRRKLRLLRMYYSKKYEHCLGAPVIDLASAGGGPSPGPEYAPLVTPETEFKELLGLEKRKRSSFPDIPGLNIELPEIKGIKKIPFSFKIPPRPPKIRLKMDGIAQSLIDRKLSASLLKAQQLQEYASSYCTVFIDSFNERYKSLVGRDILGYKTVYKTLAELADSSAKFMGEVGAAAGRMAVGLYDLVTKVPINQLPNFYDAVAMVFKSTADNFVSAYMAATRWKKEYEEAMKELSKLNGYSPQENTQFVYWAMQALKAKQKIQKGTEKAADLVFDGLLTIATMGAGEIAAAFKVGEETATGMKLLAQLATKDFQRLHRMAMIARTMEEAKAILNILKMKKALAVGERLAKLEKLESSIAKLTKQLSENMEKLAKTQTRIAKLEKVASQTAIREMESPPKLPPAKPVKPKDILLTEQGKPVQLADELGSGQLGDVYVNAANPNEVYKVFKTGGALKTVEDMEKAAARELEGANILKQAGIEHIEITEHGKLVDGRPFLKKRRLAENEYTIERLYKFNGKEELTEGQKKAVIDFITECNKKGIFLGDFKPENLYWRNLGGDRWKVGMLDTDFIKILGKDFQEGGRDIFQIQALQMGKDGRMFAQAVAGQYAGGGAYGGWDKIFGRDFLENYAKKGREFANTFDQINQHYGALNPEKYLSPEEASELQALKSSAKELSDQASNTANNLSDLMSNIWDEIPKIEFGETGTSQIPKDIDPNKLLNFNLPF